MPFSEPFTPPAQQSFIPADAEALVREALLARRKAATPDQRRRLVKTLERLYPAANTALAGAAADNTGSPERSFESVLARLSDA